MDEQRDRFDFLGYDPPPRIVSTSAGGEGKAVGGLAGFATVAQLEC